MSRLIAVEGWLPIFFLLVVLKIPVLGALWLVWWASRPPEPDGASEDSDGGFGRWLPEPAGPRGPRRGPHLGAARRARRGLPQVVRRGYGAGLRAPRLRPAASGSGLLTVRRPPLARRRRPPS